MDDIKYSSTQINLPRYLVDVIQLWIDSNIRPDMLAPDEENDVLHITVKYGLHTNDPETVRVIVSNFGWVIVKLGLISVFNTDSNYDVLKIDVESEPLKDLNRLISNNLEVTDTFPDYRPHVTLAYLKKGYADKFVGSDVFNRFTFMSFNMLFSDRDQNKTVIEL